MPDDKTEWERITEENAKFKAWYESEMAPKLEKADTFTKAVTENAAIMAWHAAMGLDLGRALEGLVRQKRAELDEMERQLESREADRG